jgi:hypothetical protein
MIFNQQEQTCNPKLNLTAIGCITSSPEVASTYGMHRFLVIFYREW